MATFDEFYASLDPDVGVRGKQFEKFVKWFLKTDPTWASQIDEVWLWNDYPNRWGADCGIDLVFTHKNGKTWAVQSKCISPDNDIKKSEIDSFLSESSDSKIDGRLLIASTDGIGKNAQQVIYRQEKQVVCFLLEQFRQSEIEFPSSMDDLNQGKRKKKKKPRPHQIEAIEKVSEGIKTADRGQVLMACGTGKTLTSLWITEKVGAKQVLVLVPSLSLLSQILKEWNTEANYSFKWICVCSDKSVSKDKSEDQWISNTSEIGVPVTNEPLEIKQFLDESGYKVVFSTYQSAPLIVEAQEHHDTSPFDLVIADEAHRCAGKVSDAFGVVLDDNKIKATKKLFFTATPRILSKRLKTNSLAMDFAIASMDDNSIFGNILYQIKFSEAIKQEILTDYQVVVIGIDDEMIKQRIAKKELLKLDDQTILDTEMLASQIAIKKAIQDYDLDKIITFHSRIEGAKNFAKSFDQVIENIKESDSSSKLISCEHISGKMKTAERNQKLHELKNLEVNEKKILTNARCLSEGIDVPTLSGIAFVNPKQSQIDIIQAVGRAIRKSDSKKKGTIIIPIYISPEDYVDEVILMSNFKKVWQIVHALKSQDDALMECIHKLRIQKGNNGTINSGDEILDKFIFDIPQKIIRKFSDSITTLLVNNTSEDWYEQLGKIKKFYKDHGKFPTEEKSSLTYWCMWQRNNYKKKKLSKEKIELLENINFTWHPDDVRWNEKYEELKEFYKNNGNLIAPDDRSSIGQWCSAQRNKYKKQRLKKERIELLEKLNFKWDPEEERWHSNYQNLKTLYDSKRHLDLNKSEYHLLRKWCTHQRRVYKKKKLTKEKINLLNKINFAWNPREQKWMNSYIQLKEIYDKDPANLPFNPPTVGTWCNSQRDQYKRNLLTKEKINLLNKINFVWNALDKKWNDYYLKLKNLYLKNKDISVIDDEELTNWIQRQRKLYKSSSLPKQRINLLNQINFIWDFRQEMWDMKYHELQKFYMTEGKEQLDYKTPLGRWCMTQKMEFKNKRLSKEKITLLKKIGLL